MKSMGQMVEKSFTCASYRHALLLKAVQHDGLAPCWSVTEHAAVTSAYDMLAKSVEQVSAKLILSQNSQKSW
jgi:hypothetical protein